MDKKSKSENIATQVQKSMDAISGAEVKEEPEIKTDIIKKTFGMYRPDDVVVAYYVTPQDKEFIPSGGINQFKVISNVYRKFFFRYLRPAELGEVYEQLFDELIKHFDDLPKSLQEAFRALKEGVKSRAPKKPKGLRK